MKLVTLNLWGGQVFEPLMRFIKTHASNTDIFCFQEVLFSDRAEFTPEIKARMNLFNEIKQRLPEFEALTFMAPEKALHFQDELLPEDVRPGQAMFVRKGLRIIENGGFRTYKKLPEGADIGGKVPGNCQWMTILQPNGMPVTIMNLHGVWQRGTLKVDTPARLEQSQILQDFIRSKSGRRILCGDFNLLETGESLRRLEIGMKNWVREAGVTGTRSSYYQKSGTKFADYILTTPEVEVDKFAVLQDEVSDHLPLIMTWK